MGLLHWLDGWVVVITLTSPRYVCQCYTPSQSLLSWQSSVFCSILKTHLLLIHDQCGNRYLMAPCFNYSTAECHCFLLADGKPQRGFFIFTDFGICHHWIHLWINVFIYIHEWVSPVQYFGIYIPSLAESCRKSHFCMVNMKLQPWDQYLCLA